MTDLIGYIASICTTAAFMPQAWLIWKTRSAQGVSLMMYSVFTLGVVLWLIYAVLIGSTPMIIANIVTLSLALFIVAMKLRFG
jgi:MtN3 and saliva related transmembrane protein